MKSVPSKWSELNVSMDFICYEHQTNTEPFYIGYYRTLTDPQILREQILDNLCKDSEFSLQDLHSLIPIAEKEESSDWTVIQNKLLHGYVAIQQGLEEENCLLIHAELLKGRDVTQADVEYTVEGPKEAFVEQLDVNLNLLRRRIPIPETRIKEIIVGSLSKTRVAVCYIEGITNEQVVNTCIQRIEAVQFDLVPEITLLQQLIEDNSNSIFPQLIGTERPDRAVWGLTMGQVCVIMDGSPTAILGPTNLGMYFFSYEDYFLPWIIGSILRIIRMVSVVFSIFATSLYVAVISHHGQLISITYLPTIVSSRLDVPFPPVVEVLIMELVIELLREAGARLPSKIGQTIGIVGGIVLGTAAVQAAMTSNFLLIIVALSALASFTTPIFRMSTTIRILRFPFIIAAQIWGLVGIFICGFVLVTHLLRLTSLGAPYLVPFYPLRTTDFADSAIRAPYSTFYRRPSFMRSPTPAKFDKKIASLKKDIDE